MNTKAEQNSQKGPKDLLNTHNYSKKATGKLMDNILSNMKTHVRKTHQSSSNGIGGMPVQSKLEPEYLNNILIDINDVNRLKTKHKLNGLLKTPDRSPTRKPTTTTTTDDPKSVQKPLNTILSKTEKRPKSSIKRRLKKFIESNKKRSVVDDDDRNKVQGTSAHSSRQQQQKMTKKDVAHVQIVKEETANNVQQISNPEQSIINNTSTSIAESNKREPKFKNTKKDAKKKDLKEKASSVNKSSAGEHSSDASPPDADKKTKYKQKPKSNKKNSSVTSCPPSILTKTSNTQSQQSKKIKLIVNQIASNLKQSGRFELNTGNIKRDIYIKGLSTCMTSQALEQINRILNPPRAAAYKANLASAKNNMLVKSNQVQNGGTAATEETSRPTTSQKDKRQLSKINIANEINTFNKQPSPSSSSQPSPPPQLPVQTLEYEIAESRAKDIMLAQVLKEKERQADKEQTTPKAAETTINLTPPMNNQEQELIKKINEKIDKIISSGLSSCDTFDTSTSSLSTSPDDNTKSPPQPPPPPQPPIPFLPPAKTTEPPKFMQAPNVRSNIPKINTTTTTQTPAANTTKSNREPRANESPPIQPQAQAKAPDQPHIKKIINVVRNSEIVNEIKLNTITVLQNAVSKSAQNAQQTPTEKPNNTTNNKVVEKKCEDDEKTKKTLDIAIGKINPSLKRFQLSNDKIGQLNADKLTRTQTSLNSVRKPSKNMVLSNSTLNPMAGGGAGSNRPTVTTTHLAKTSTNSSTNGTNSSSTLNLIAALSTSKKFALLSPMEVVQDFVNLVNHAKRNRKTFTICGNFYSLRRAFAERGWVEKMRINIMDDRDTWRKIEGLSNFELVDGMRNKEYGEKYRRVFLTKLLAGHQVDFYWDYLTNPFAVNNDKIKRTLINRFPYGATRAYTSKHGLTESLRDAHWYCIEGYANIFYPRTYNLSMIEEMTSFVEDFRITAVISLLQWIVANMTTPDKILSASGDVPTSVYNFATIQCHNYIKMKEHKDIDEVIPQAKDYEWEVFLEKFYKIVHNENCFKANERISAQLMIEQSKYVLKKVKKYLPNLHLDGFKNMWLLKPNNGSRGCGIHVCRTLKYMMETVNNRKDIKYVVQKYLERPLLIHKTKFDIRQWFLVTCMPNVKVWLYKECYLRFSSQMFDLNKLHESIHLTNNSIQCRYKNNNQRSTSLPEQNMWDSETFKKYLTEIGQPYAWRNNIYKGMKECLIALFMLCQSKMELRINSFELCGADFMLSEDYHPYLIEINSRPALYASTKITARMCPKVLEDVIKVTVDHARNPKASTGDFELIYTDSFNYAIPRNVNNLYIEGMSYFSKFIETKPSIGLNTIVPIQAVKEVKNDSIKKILNIEPDVVKIDVRNTLEKILAVVHNDSNSKIKETPEERNKKFRSMLSEFVNIISTVKNVNEEV